MEAGTGIFWGLLVLALVVLYLKTRDRWNWRKIVVRSTLLVFGLAACIWLGLWGTSWHQNRVIAVTEFLGVKLTDTTTDIKFKKGKPKYEGNDGFWAFVGPDNDYESIVLIRDKKLRAIQYVGKCTYCHNVFGLGISTSYDQVLEKLGQPTHVASSEDSLRRIASFDQWNLFFQLEEGKVVSLGMYDRTFGPMKFDAPSRQQ